MSPHELELMLLINKNFLSPSIFDKVMKWACSATAEGYKFDSPSYSTLKKQINYTFPNTINGGGLKSKVIILPDEVRSDLPVTMLYFEKSFGVVCKVPLRSSSHEGLCLLSPEEIYWLWIICVRQDYIRWLVLWSIQQFTYHWKWNAQALACVYICWYRALWWFFKYWPFDEELRASFPTNYTTSNTRASSIINHLTLGCWCLYYLILRWVISKSLNQITSQIVIIFPFVAWNCTTNALSFCILHSKILTSIMISGCMVLAGCMSTFKWVWS